MQVLEGELLRKVLHHLRSWQDLAISSAVSKEWHAATQQVYLTSMVLPERGMQPINPANLNHTLRWLQQKQAVGQLRRITEADLHIPSEDEQSEDCNDDMLALFLHSSLALLSPCHLSRVDIKGPFFMAQAVPLLPKTVQYLSCMPDAAYLPLHISSSMFSNLPNLLCLGVYCINLNNELEGKHPTFTVDAPFLSLNSLVLELWALTASRDSSFVDCFPKLQHLLAHCPCDTAESLLDLTRLSALGLVLDDVPFDHSGILWSRPGLRIPAKSRLRTLHLSGPSSTPFHVDLSKSSKELFVTHHKGDFSYSVGTETDICHPDWNSMYWFKCYWQEGIIIDTGPWGLM